MNFEFSYTVLIQEAVVEVSSEMTTNLLQVAYSYWGKIVRVSTIQDQDSGTRYFSVSFTSIYID